MNYEMKPYPNHPCILKTFKINGTIASQQDFGYPFDGGVLLDEDKILRRGCLNRRFNTRPFEYNLEVVEKYNLTRDEYTEICEALEDILSVGCCGHCIVLEF